MAGGHGTAEWEWLGDKIKHTCKRFIKRFEIKNIKLDQFNKLGNDIYGVGGWNVLIRSL